MRVSVGSQLSCFGASLSLARPSAPTQLSMYWMRPPTQLPLGIGSAKSSTIRSAIACAKGRSKVSVCHRLYRLRSVSKPYARQNKPSSATLMPCTAAKTAFRASPWSAGCWGAVCHAGAHLWPSAPKSRASINSKTLLFVAMRFSFLMAILGLS